MSRKRLTTVWTKALAFRCRCVQARQVLPNKPGEISTAMTRNEPRLVHVQGTRDDPVDKVRNLGRDLWEAGARVHERGKLTLGMVDILGWVVNVRFWPFTESETAQFSVLR